MGFLLDLIHRLLGPRTRPAAPPRPEPAPTPVAPARPVEPMASPEDGPIPVALEIFHPPLPPLTEPTPDPEPAPPSPAEPAPPSISPAEPKPVNAPALDRAEVVASDLTEVEPVPPEPEPILAVDHLPEIDESPSLEITPVEPDLEPAPEPELDPEPVSEPDPEPVSEPEPEPEPTSAVAVEPIETEESTHAAEFGPAVEIEPAESISPESALGPDPELETTSEPTYVPDLAMAEPPTDDPIEPDRFVPEATDESAPVAADPEAEAEPTPSPRMPLATAVSIDAGPDEPTPKLSPDPEIDPDPVHVEDELVPSRVAEVDAVDVFAPVAAESDLAPSAPEAEPVQPEEAPGEEPLTPLDDSADDAAIDHEPIEEAAGTGQDDPKSLIDLMAPETSADDEAELPAPGLVEVPPDESRDFDPTPTDDWDAEGPAEPLEDRAIEPQILEAPSVPAEAEELVEPEADGAPLSEVERADPPEATPEVVIIEGRPSFAPDDVATPEVPTPPREPKPLSALGLRPLGLAANLTAPLLGILVGGEAEPALADLLDDLGRDPRTPPESPEAAALRDRTDRDLVLAGYLDAATLNDARSALAEPPAPLDPDAWAARRAAAQEACRAQAERRAEARRSEILYLGRGVSEALHDHRANPARLAELGLPPLDRPADLADRLGITVGRLRWLAFHAEVAARVHYVSFEVAKASGGTRRLSAPHRTLAQAQRWIFEAIVGRLPVEPEAHGFVPGRSILTNAQPHAGQAVLVNLDLEGFFPSIGHRAVRSVFERAGYSPAVATVLSLLCTEAPRRAVVFEGVVQHVATGPRGLPQGACTSPGLANQVARRFDRRLRGLARHLGATYTRYADDLSFSGGPDLNGRVGALLAAVRRIAASEGFRVHEGKTRVQRPNTAQVVTGLVVNDRPGVPRMEARRIRAILHRARVEGLDAQNRLGHPDFRASLVGRIAFVGMARPELGARLLAEYRALDAPPAG